MDCGRFIRKPGVLALWLITPLLLVLLTALGSIRFHTRSQAKFLRASALEKYIPAMQLENSRFTRFLEEYAGAGNCITPAEDLYIACVNGAAGSTSFSVSSIRLTKNLVDAVTKAHRLNIHVEGSGSTQSIAAFLHNIKNQDRFLFEDKVSLERSRGENNLFSAKINLSKIYVEPGEATP